MGRKNLVKELFDLNLTEWREKNQNKEYFKLYLQFSFVDQSENISRYEKREVVKE